MASPPSVIADAVAKAVTARRPRTRYAVGRGAKPILAARRVLPDRAFDRLMNATLRTLSRTAARRARAAGATV
jgi:hypothetical protein